MSTLELNVAAKQLNPWQKLISYTQFTEALIEGRYIGVLFTDMPGDVMGAYLSHTVPSIAWFEESNQDHRYLVAHKSHKSSLSVIYEYTHINGNKYRRHMFKKSCVDWQQWVTSVATPINVIRSIYMRMEDPEVEILS